METFQQFLDQIQNIEQKRIMSEVLAWVTNNYPTLQEKIGWNQPMFTDHGTYIIGFSVAKHHIAVSPEQVVIEKFADQIKQANLQASKMIVKFPFDKPFNYDLLKLFIDYNIMDKAQWDKFWR